MSKRTLIVRASAALILLALIAFSQQRSDPAWSPYLLLNITDAATGQPTAARFSIAINGTEIEPRWVGPHGWRFVSIHFSKRQSYTVTYARGTGPVEVPLPPGTRSVEIRAAKGLDYTPIQQTIAITRESTPVTIALRRANRLHEEGWRAADPHLHYDRIRPESDLDWFDAMEADGLSFTHFLVLKGGMLPGIWARQFAYGAKGEGARRETRIIPGQEYRDQLQGHLLLFGLNGIIQPIMAGTTESPNHWPPARDVLNQARHEGAIAGAAHGGTLGQSPTILADAILGALDFVELGNLFLWQPEKNWYPLLNCGYVLTPTAGSDLPNVPYRDWWQPFLGSIRTYVKTGPATTTAAFNAALKRGESFVTSGPIIRLSVNGAGPGARIDLPSSGGEVELHATLESPRPMRSLEIVQNGKVVATAGSGQKQLEIRTRLPIRTSSWLAARATGAPIPAMNQTEVAHTAAIQVLTAGRRIWSDEDAARLSATLAQQKEFYRRNGRYATEQDRQAMLTIFDTAIAQLRRD